RIPLVRTSSESTVRRPGKMPRGAHSQSVPRPARDDPLSPREQLEQSTDSRRVRGWDPRAQPSEPILFHIRVGRRPELIGGPASPFHIRPGCIAGPHPLPSRQFQALFDSLFKVLFIFPSRYLFAIGLTPGCIPKQPDSQTAPRGATGSRHNGALTLSGAPFQGTWARSATEDASPDYNSDARGDRFSCWALPGSLAVTRGIL
ncbi:hypothetical protein S83_035654, partial [Arachis hypogaea]